MSLLPASWQRWVGNHAFCRQEYSSPFPLSRQAPQNSISLETPGLHLQSIWESVLAAAWKVPISPAQATQTYLCWIDKHNLTMLADQSIPW